MQKGCEIVVSTISENLDAQRLATLARAGSLAGARRITAPEITAPAQTPTASEPASVNGGESLFGSLIDTVNPLQHIPGVSTVYRATTGDTMSPLATMGGGLLFGGPLGLAVGAATTFIELMTGASPAEHAMALLFGDDGETETGNLDDLGEHASLGDTPLVGENQTRAPDEALALVEAEAVRNPGFGAQRDTVAISSSIWTDRALMNATEKYENAERLGEDPRSAKSAARDQEKTDRTV